MARLLVLSDRGPDDRDWKGALTWRMILAMAESQHEVMAAGPMDPSVINVTHSRLTVAQPLTSWGVINAPRLLQALVYFKPQIIHTFALRPNRTPAALTLWPYLNAICTMTKDLKRFSTLFEESDGSPKDASHVWHQGSQRLTVFTERHRAQLAEQEQPNLAHVDLVPLDLDFTFPQEATSPANDFALVPAAVSEWAAPEKGLEHLGEVLRRHPDKTVRIVGGWRAWPSSRRKMGWQQLGECAARVTMTEAMSLQNFIGELRACESLWLEPLRRDSWKLLLSGQLALQMNKPVFTATPLVHSVKRGSTVNSFSRLYAGN